MSDEERHTMRKTTGSFRMVPGNVLFEATVRAIDFDDAVARALLMSALGTIGLIPETLSPDELGALLPELERRLRELAPGDRAERSMRAVQHLLIGWAEEA